MTPEQAFAIVAERLEEDENRPATFGGFEFQNTGTLFWYEQGTRIGEA